MPAEREVCETFGPTSQLPPNWPLHVPEQFPRQQPREAPGPQEHRGPPHLHHLLQDEGEQPIEPLVKRREREDFVVVATSHLNMLEILEYFMTLSYMRHLKSWTLSIRVVMTLEKHLKYRFSKRKKVYNTWRSTFLCVRPEKLYILIGFVVFCLTIPFYHVC